MAFQVKDFTSIIASMINHARGTTDKLTDFNVGSVNRVMVESPAIEIDELYQQMFHGLKEAIPTAIYQSFNFSKVPAVIAATNVTFTASVAPSGNPIVIPINTVIRVPGSSISYSTDIETSIAVAQTTAIVRVNAGVAGITGNTLANTITEIDNPIATVSVTNPNAVVSGKDEETEDVRKLRFIEYIQTISRAPKASVIFGAKSSFLTDVDGNITEKVDKANVYEPYVTDNTQPLGYIDCYIYDGLGTASSELVAETQKTIDGFIDTESKRVMGWKAAGVICTVASTTIVNQNITVVLTVDPGLDVADFITPVDTAIRDYLNNLDVSENVVRSELIKIIQNVPGIYNSNLTVPASDTTILFNEKSLPGTMSIS